MNGHFAAATLETLVCRILSGEAVFLIGAGFSLDSEANTASRLIARLMALLRDLGSVQCSRTEALRRLCLMKSPADRNRRTAPGTPATAPPRPRPPG